MPSGRRENLTNHKPEHVGLPPRFFLYTLDQIAVMLDVGLDQIKREYIYYEGRDVGVAPRDRMTARNIAPHDSVPEWRVAEREIIRWFKFKGFKFHTRGWVTS